MSGFVCLIASRRTKKNPKLYGLNGWFKTAGFGETLQSEQLEGCHSYEGEAVLSSQWWCNHGNRLTLENQEKHFSRGNISHCSSERREMFATQTSGREVLNVSWSLISSSSLPRALAGPDRSIRVGEAIFYHNETHKNAKVLECPRSKLTLRLRVAPRRGRRWRPRWAGLGHGRGHLLFANELHVCTRKVAFLLLVQRKI